MPNLNFQPSKPPDRSWLYITCAVVVIHSLIIGWTVFFNTKSPESQPEMNSRLVVQTIAFNSYPIPSNPIPKNRVTPTPIPATPITPTPLERKTMWPSDSLESPTNPETVNQVEQAVPRETTSLPPSPISLPPLRPATNPYVKPSSKPPVTPTTPIKPKETPKTPAKVVPQKTPDTLKSPFERANEEFKAKQQEISVKRKLELEALKAQQQQEAFKKKQEQEALKKKQEETLKKKAEAEHLAEKQRQQKLVAKAQESIAKITGSRDKIPSKTANSTPVLHAITHLEIDSLSEIKGDISLSRYEMSYREELASRLKLLLRLPEYGDVKVNLTLDRTGKVSKVAIVNADSMVNRKYIEKTLPGLSFPAFGTHYASAAEYTFSITLSNEI